jgi:hypothetical protein
MADNPICQYCNDESTHNQPDKDTGQIISVCKKHFTMSASS